MDVDNFFSNADVHNLFWAFKARTTEAGRLNERLRPFEKRAM